jgi:hypothetical protein
VRKLERFIYYFTETQYTKKDSYVEISPFSDDRNEPDQADKHFDNEE